MINQVWRLAGTLQEFFEAFAKALVGYSPGLGLSLS
jgi:hypothetical protein